MNSDYRSERDHTKKQALTGLKIADFGRLVNAPMATKYLGDNGAEVVLIESSHATRPVLFPFADGVPGPNRSGTFAAYNSSKFSICLNFNNPGGLEVAKMLVKRSDVVVENFIPGIMEKWGLGYDAIKQLKPDIIMVRSSMAGQTGPQSTQKGTGEQLSALSGFSSLTGWPDRMVTGVTNAYTDFIAPFYILNAIMVALTHKRKTGKGSYIDLSQFEAGVSFIADLIIDNSFNGRIQEAIGNRCNYAAPHGAYRCKGDDRWCVIAVFNDNEWKSFCNVIGEPEWTRNPKFASLETRKKNETELDELIGEWTANYSANEVMRMMQLAGVPSGVVQKNKDVCNDVQLDYRQHFKVLNQPEIGMFSHENSSFRLSECFPEIRPAPCFGEHTEYVCRNILGMSEELFIEMFQKGAFTGPGLLEKELSEKYFSATIKNKISAGAC